MSWFKRFKEGGGIIPASLNQVEPGQGRFVFVNEVEAKEFSARVGVTGKGIARLTTENGELWIDTSLLPGDTCEGDRFRVIIEKKIEQP